MGVIRFIRFIRFIRAGSYILYFVFYNFVFLREDFLEDGNGVFNAVDGVEDN